MEFHATALLLQLGQVQGFGFRQVQGFRHREDQVQGLCHREGGGRGGGVNERVRYLGLRAGGTEGTIETSEELDCEGEDKGESGRKWAEVELDFLLKTPPKAIGQ